MPKTSKISSKEKPVADHSLAERLAFMKLDSKSQDAIKSIKQVIDTNLPGALDIFYAHISKVPEVSRFFSDASHMKRAKGAQVGHWSNISSANFGDEYAKAVHTIGNVHARIGLEPRWYIGGYALITEQLINAVVAEMWPRGFSGKSKIEAGHALGALMKAIFLDMDLAISIYIEASEAAREKAEAASRTAEEERLRAEKAAEDEHRRAEAEAAEHRRQAEETRAEEARKQAVVVNALTQALSRLNHGDLTTRLIETFDPVYQKLQDDFNATVSQLEAAIQTVATSTREVANAASEISVATTSLSQRTETQAAGLEQTSAAMEQIAATVQKNAEYTSKANTLTTGARDVAHRGDKVVSDAVAAMSEIQESSKKIGDIIGVIDEIARQTNLLALNAAVEAARAGDAGRGFAVVASEVRSLAQRSSQAAKDIKELITTSSSQVDNGVALVGQAGTVLTDVVAAIGQVATIVVDIEHASKEQATGIVEVNKALQQMDEATQQNSALVEENAATAKTLEDQSAAMNDKVRFFRIGNAGASAAAKSPAVRQQQRLATALKPTTQIQEF